ncbi:MAG: 6-pyruvoyl-tetrahydropterin synthase-related protein [Rhodococcus sp. (in: high G+C Gram-positive bacteria)]
MPTATERPSRRPDLVAAAVYSVLSVAVLANQWLHLRTDYLRLSGQDQTMWEWFFAVTAKSVVHLDNPFFTDLQNAPDGVNMMANTAMLGLSVPLTPITLAFGASTTFALALTLGLATTAFGWYFLFSRTIVTSRAAAGLGGLICGFAPGMISHANAHPNFVVLGVLPFILYLLVRIGGGDARRRHAVLLGLLAAWQVLLGEEPLLIFAVATGLLTLLYWAVRPRIALPMIRRSALPVLGAAILAAALIAVPLWWQFRGPQSYSYLDHNLPGNDVLSLVQFPPQSLWGTLFPSDDLALNATEQNAYFGIPLLILVVVATVLLRRRPIAVAAAGTIVILIVLSFGTQLIVDEAETGITMPGALFDRLPLLQSVLDTRFTLAAVPAMALLITLVTDRVLTEPTPRRRAAGWTFGLAVALVPLIPAVLPTADRGETPAFLADGAWRDYIDSNPDGTAGSILTVPVPSPGTASALRWQVDTGLEYRIAGGYFVGPSGQPDGEAKYGAIDRPTAKLLGTVGRTGIVPALSDDRRRTARDDLQFWQADVVMLPPTEYQDELRETLDDLLDSPSTVVGDTYVWDVR